MKIKALEIICLLSLFVCIIFSTLSFDSECEDIRQNILRLHVIANSDTKKDQALKYQVRDELLKSGSFSISDAKSKTEAQKNITNELDSLRKTAQQKVYDSGFGYKVKVEVAESYFPTRQYDDITLPAGYYDALKVIIGEGKGQNWWCVMFPNLCLPAATKTGASPEDILSDEQIKIIKKHGRYEVRFWLLEKYYELTKKSSSQ